MEIYGGLNPTPPDERDFELGSLFPLPQLSEIPDEFSIGEPTQILDQLNSDFCTAFAVTGASDYQENLILSPEWQFAKMKQMTGENLKDWGMDLRTALKSAVKIGSVPINEVSLRLNGGNRDIAADYRNYPSHLDSLAERYKKPSFFKVTGQYDLFDNIRAALWFRKDEQRAVIVGLEWKPQWTLARGGVIPSDAISGSGFGHAFILIGTKLIDGIIYLKAQLSNGLKVGDGGYFYFPREAVNREIVPYGAYNFQKEKAEDIKKSLGRKSFWFNIRQLLGL